MEFTIIKLLVRFGERIVILEFPEIGYRFQIGAGISAILPGEAVTTGEINKLL